MAILVNGPAAADLLSSLLGGSAWRLGLITAVTPVTELAVAGYARKRVTLSEIAAASAYDAPSTPDIQEAVTLQNPQAVQWGPFAVDITIVGYLLAHTAVSTAPFVAVFTQDPLLIAAGQLVQVRPGTVSWTAGAFGGS